MWSGLRSLCHCGARGNDSDKSSDVKLRYTTILLPFNLRSKQLRIERLLASRKCRRHLLDNGAKLLSTQCRGLGDRGLLQFRPKERMFEELGDSSPGCWLPTFWSALSVMRMNPSHALAKEGCQRHLCKQRISTSRRWAFRSSGKAMGFVSSGIACSFCQIVR